MRVNTKEAFLLRGGRQLPVVLAALIVVIVICLLVAFASPLTLLNVFDYCVGFVILAVLATPFVFVGYRLRRATVAARRKEDLRLFNKIFKPMSVDIFRKENHRLVQMHIDVMLAMLAVKREEAAQQLFEATIGAKRDVLPGMRVKALAKATRCSKIAIGKYRRAVALARRLGYEVKAGHMDYIDRLDD